MKNLWMSLFSLAMLMAVHISNSDGNADEWFRRGLSAEVEDRRIERRGECFESVLKRYFRN